MMNRMLGEYDWLNSFNRSINGNNLKSVYVALHIGTGLSLKRIYAARGITYIHSVFILHYYSSSIHNILHNAKHRDRKLAYDENSTWFHHY